MTCLSWICTMHSVCVYIYIYTQYNTHTNVYYTYIQVHIYIDACVHLLYVQTRVLDARQVAFHTASYGCIHTCVYRHVRSWMLVRRHFILHYTYDVCVRDRNICEEKHARMYTFTSWADARVLYLNTYTHRLYVNILYIYMQTVLNIDINICVYQY